MIDLSGYILYQTTFNGSNALFANTGKVDGVKRPETLNVPKTVLEERGKLGLLSPREHGALSELRKKAKRLSAPSPI